MRSAPDLSDLTIRPAVRADLPAIVAMLADDEIGAAREDARDPLPASYYEAFDRIEAQRGNHVMVAERNGAVVGCYQITIIPGLSYQGMSRAELEGIRVASPLRGSGIGTALVRHAIKTAKAEGCGLIQGSSTLTRTRAIALYQRLGFVHSHAGLKMVLSEG